MNLPQILKNLGNRKKLKKRKAKNLKNLKSPKNLKNLIRISINDLIDQIVLKNKVPVF